MSSTACLGIETVSGCQGVSLIFVFPKVETKVTHVLPTKHTWSFTMQLKPKDKKPAGPHSLQKLQEDLTSITFWEFTKHPYCFTVSCEEKPLSLLLASGGLLAIPGMTWCAPMLLTCRGCISVSEAMSCAILLLCVCLNVCPKDTRHMDTYRPVPGWPHRKHTSNSLSPNKVTL